MYVGPKPIEVNQEFEMGKLSEYADGSMNNWSHHIQYILPQVSRGETYRRENEEREREGEGQRQRKTKRGRNEREVKPVKEERKERVVKEKEQKRRKKKEEREKEIVHTVTHTQGRCQWFNPIPKADDEFDEDEEDEDKEQPEELEPETGPQILTAVAEDERNNNNNNK